MKEKGTIPFVAEVKNPFPCMNPYLGAGWGGTEADVWFVDLPQPLPCIQIPLLALDPDVVVNLQAALEDAYEEGQYHQVINYAADCPAPLPPDAREWVYNLLRDKGLRK